MCEVSTLTYSRKIGGESYISNAASCGPLSKTENATSGNVIALLVFIIISDIYYFNYVDNDGYDYSLDYNYYG